MTAVPLERAASRFHIAGYWARRTSVAKRKCPAYGQDWMRRHWLQGWAAADNDLSGGVKSDAAHRQRMKRWAKT